MAGVGQLDRAVFALRGPDLGRDRLAPGSWLAFGQRRRPGPGAGAVAGRLSALVLREGVEGVAGEVVDDDPELFAFGAEGDTPGPFFRPLDCGVVILRGRSRRGSVGGRRIGSAVAAATAR